ncbi:MAG: hypothetical protein ACRDH2_00895 [Anaerolineales bacterium]
MNGQYAALAGRIRNLLLDVERVVNRAEVLQEKALRTGDDGYWDGVALNLHGFYAGVEQIFLDIARTLEGSIPTGPLWRQDLVVQMSAEVVGIRPAVIERYTRECLDEYRSFRHIVRNVYTFNLRPARLQELVTGLRPCLKAVNRDLYRFAAFLDSTAQAS